MADPLDNVSVDDLEPAAGPDADPAGAAPPAGDPDSPLPAGGILSEEAFVETWASAWDLAAVVTRIEELAHQGDPRSEPAGRAAYRIILRNPALHWMLRDTAWAVDYAVLGLFLWAKAQIVRAHVAAARDPGPEPPRPDDVGAPEDVVAGASEIIVGTVANPDLPEAA